MRRFHFILTLCCVALFANNLQAQTDQQHLIANLALRQELLRKVKQDQVIRNELIKKALSTLTKRCSHA